MQGTNWFSETFSLNGSGVLLLSEGREYTYQDVYGLSREAVMPLEDWRRLIFIEGENSLSSIAAYLGALAHGHVVHLLDPQKRLENAALVERYKPNVVVKCGHGNISWDVVNDERLSLHPDVCILLSTSGTTGASKFVKLSYDNIRSNALSIAKYLELSAMDRAISSLKPFYSYGMSVINSHFAAGASIALTEASAQDPEFWQVVTSADVTNIAGVPYTFEMLDSMKVDWARYPSLRFLTQAGGRLSPSLIQKFAALGPQHGWKLYVMYGQTEASPRISYLPPDRADKHPNSIGIAIPGGHLDLVDEDGHSISHPNVEGELVYSGPNVMVGYANGVDELATADQIDRLFTGDLATKNEDGLFFITGRRSRFVKPFGLRVSLDEVEKFLNEIAGPGAVVGNGETIFAFTEVGVPADTIRQLSEKYSLPAETFRSLVIDTIPRLSNGKIDYKSLTRAAKLHDEEESRPTARKVATYFAHEFWQTIFGRTFSANSVLDVFVEVFRGADVSLEDTFISLEGDSMRFVQTSMMLEECIGYLPENWQNIPIKDLEKLKVSAEMLA